jgi:hypothetical protein
LYFPHFFYILLANYIFQISKIFCSFLLIYKRRLIFQFFYFCLCSVWNSAEISSDDISFGNCSVQMWLLYP